MGNAELTERPRAATWRFADPQHRHRNPLRS